MKIERVLVLSSPTLPGCEAAAKRLLVDLRAAGMEAFGRREDFDARKIDLVLLLGGDGFLMDSVSVLGFPPTPFFGVNFGSVGFLMNPKACLEGLAATIGEGRFQAEEHPVLKGQVRFVDGREESLLAVNDFVMERTGGQSVRLKILVNGTLLNELSGDGVIVATSMGSTAYNLAAGGPVLHPKLPAITVTPLYPHRAAPFHSLQFSVLLPLDSNLVLVGVDLLKRPVRLVADGRPAEGPAEVTVRDSGLRLRLLRTETHEFVSTLARKFIGTSG